MTTLRIPKSFRLSDDSDVVEPAEHTAVAGLRAAVSTQSSFSTRAALRILANGGNAFDAAIAASMVDGVVNCLLTNHAGSVVALLWDAREKRAHELNSTGVFPPGIAPCAPLPDVGHPLTAIRLLCCLPGFMPGLRALHERFGTKPWSELTEDAIYWAEEGFPLSSYIYGLNVRFLPITTYFPQTRALFLPEGFPPPAGARFRNPELARTLRGVASAGPDHMISGEWAREFVATANSIGWPIQARHLREVAPRWCEPARFRVGEYELVQQSPPQIQVVFSALTLGVLHELGAARDITDADWWYFCAHALRWADRDASYINDPRIFETSLQPWLTSSYARTVASILATMRPRQDLRPALVDPAYEAHAGRTLPTKAGSCEISIIDSQGNRVQLLNTMQTGGLPGMTVGGVPMLGSHATPGTLAGKFAVWPVPDARPRYITGNTFVLRDGEPFLGLGASGCPIHHVPQVLSRILQRRQEPHAAISAPRLLAPIDDENRLAVEARIDETSATALESRGVRLRRAKPYDLDAGWFECTWTDRATGLHAACTDPRGNGVAGGLL